LAGAIQVPKLARFKCRSWRDLGAEVDAILQLGFDNHKHDTDGRIIPAEPPSIEVLVQEIIDYITRQTT